MEKSFESLSKDSKWLRPKIITQQGCTIRLDASESKIYAGFKLAILVCSRLLTVTALLAVLLTGTLLSAPLPHGQAVLLQQRVSRGISQNQRRLVKSNWRGEPVLVNNVKLKGKPAEFGKAFSDADDDWLKGFSVNVTNSSNKDIVFIELTLTLFEKEEGLTPTRTPVAYPVLYGASEGFLDGSTKAHPVRPNGSIDVILADEAYDELKQLLLTDNYPTVFRHVDVRLDKVVFADGTVWYKSYYFYRDPNNPKRFIRDKYFQQVQSPRM